MGITLSMTGAFRETGASFFFIPKGALTHHLRSRRWYPSLRSGRALCEADCALCGERQTMPQCTPAVIVCAAGRRLSPYLLLRCKLLSAAGTTCHPPAKTCRRQLYRSYGRCLPRTVHFLLPRQKKQNRPLQGGRKDVNDYGDLSSGSKGREPWDGPFRLRGVGLSELQRHLQ